MDNSLRTKTIRFSATNDSIQYNQLHVICLIFFVHSLHWAVLSLLAVLSLNTVQTTDVCTAVTIGRLYYFASSLLQLLSVISLNKHSTCSTMASPYYSTP